MHCSNKYLSPHNILSRIHLLCLYWLNDFTHSNLGTRTLLFDYYFLAPFFSWLFWLSFRVIIGCWRIGTTVFSGYSTIVILSLMENWKGIDQFTLIFLNRSQKAQGEEGKRKKKKERKKRLRERVSSVICCWWKKAFLGTQMIPWYALLQDGKKWKHATESGCYHDELPLLSKGSCTSRLAAFVLLSMRHSSTASDYEPK
jgi:hypothetical protein